jgi:hypothetical protein
MRANPASEKDVKELNLNKYGTLFLTPLHFVFQH